MTTSPDTPTTAPNRETRASTLHSLTGRLRALRGRWAARPPEDRQVIVAMWLRAASTAAMVWFLSCHGQRVFTAAWNVVRTGTSDEIIRLVVVMLIVYVIAKYALYLGGVATGRRYGVPGEAPRQAMRTPPC